MIFAHEMFYRKQESSRNVENSLWKSLIRLSRGDFPLYPRSEQHPSAAVALRLWR